MIERQLGFQVSTQFVVYLSSSINGRKASLALLRITFSEGRVAQNALVISAGSKSPGSVAQNALDAAATSLSEGNVAQKAFVKLSSRASWFGVSGLIFFILPSPMPKMRCYQECSKRRTSSYLYHFRRRLSIRSCAVSRTKAPVNDLGSILYLSCIKLASLAIIVKLVYVWSAPL